MPTTFKSRRTWLAALLIAGALGLQTLSARAAEPLRLAGIFGDNMVLQQGPSAPVWGWAEPGQVVTVTLQNQTVRATAGPDGKWTALLKDLKLSADPVTLTVAADQTITCKNVLIGDVWLGSGQSNMEFPLRDITNGPAEAASAKFPSIRLYTVPRIMKGQRAYDVRGQWVECRPDTVPNFSALLYLFGREIHTKTKIPVGLIHSSVGGTRIELWTAPEGFDTIPEFAEYTRSIADTDKHYRENLPARLAELETWLAQSKKALAENKPVPLTPEWPEHPQPHGGASVLYDGMIYPLVPFAIRGFTWYQGEWNGGENDIYIKRMHALVNGWRKVWNNDNLPFYYVQLARMPQKEHAPWLGDGLAPTREAQRKSLAIPHTGMATIIDLEGDPGWHPRNKQDAASRLARWALHNEYGQADLVVSGPLFKQMKVEGRRARISFDYATGLMTADKKGLEPPVKTPGAAVRNFALAGADRKWYPAQAVIEGNDVIVSSPEVPTPVAVRYAYCNDPEQPNLYNAEGLPASPFRTDDW